MPVTGGMSTGDGRKLTTASSSCCTPLFLKAAPQSIGTHLNASVPLRSALLISSGVTLGELVIEIRDALEELLAHRLRLFDVRRGDLGELEFRAETFVLEHDGTHVDEV